MSLGMLAIFVSLVNVRANVGVEATVEADDAWPRKDDEHLGLER